ncbi:MAG: branched-chain amino acid ABC transporter permease [Pseudonocardia sp.]|nr:branched-chain amino acid ABC transporter permease [Pseudonocardia sp.]
MSTLLQALATGLMTGGVYALLALSIALIFKTMDTVNFATGSMGAFCAYLFFQAGTVLGLGWGAGLVAGALGAAALGWAVERGIVRPLGSGDLFRLVLATMGLDILLNNATQVFFGSGVHNINAPLPSGGWNVGGVNIDLARLVILAIAVVGAVVIALVLRYTNLGVGMRAFAQDPLAAALMGVSARTVSRWTWILSSMLGMVAAIMVASVTVLSVGFLQGAFISAFTAAVLGGLASLPGAVAGGFILGVLEALSITYAPRAVTLVLPVLIILVVLMVRPAGLFGRLSAERA